MTADTDGTVLASAGTGLFDATGVIDVNHGAAVRIEIAPDDETVVQGETGTYDATAFDADDNGWDVISDASFSTTDPSGGFVGSTYTAGGRRGLDPDGDLRQSDRQHARPCHPSPGPDP